MLLVIVTLVALGLLAAAKGIIGYYVFAAKSTRFEVGLVLIAVVAAAFALGERRVARALEARFTRNTQKHREALAALVDEIARHHRPRAARAAAGRPASTNCSAPRARSSSSEAPVARSAQSPAPTPTSRHRSPTTTRWSSSCVMRTSRWLPRTSVRPSPPRSSGRCACADSSSACSPAASTTTSRASTPPRSRPSLRSPMPPPPTSRCSILPSLRRGGRPTTCRRSSRRSSAASANSRSAGRLLQESRLLTLTGFGGAGKTRLALRIAEDLLDRYPGGVWWVELAALTDADHLASAVALAVGVPEMQGVSAAQGLAQRFGSRSVLLVLDTCEHLAWRLRAARRGIARGMRETGGAGHESGAAWRCRRTRISVAGAGGTRSATTTPIRRCWRNPTPCGSSSSARASRYRTSRPTRGRSRRSPKVCRQLDGIPLAIELAAARVKVLALDAIRDHLDDRLRLLGGGNRTLARHQTMRASIEWSHDHLDADEQQSLRRLAAFAGGFTLAAAAKVAFDREDAARRAGRRDATGRQIDAAGRARRRAAALPDAGHAAAICAGKTGRQRRGSRRAAPPSRLLRRVGRGHGEGVAWPRGAEAGDTLDREFDNLMGAHAFCGQDRGRRQRRHAARACTRTVLARSRAACPRQPGGARSAGTSADCRAVTTARGPAARCSPARLAVRRHRAGAHVARRMRDARRDLGRRGSALPCAGAGGRRRAAQWRFRGRPARARRRARRSTRTGRCVGAA